ncbi:MAG: helix-turn-helix transcriptional regulator [Methyloceanibacter sp.]|uniref:helix-turn-helix transcriptional regulator n=1 Tax=Methyloceanibacter sp. TaxID=1965321 RepID=UPI003D6C6FE9
MSNTAGPMPPKVRFSTDDLPEKDRFGELNDRFADTFLCQMRPIEQELPRPHIKGVAVALPGGVVATAGQGAGMVFDRTRAYANRRDDVMLSIILSGGHWVRQHGAEFVVRPGEAFVSLVDETGTTGDMRDELKRGMALVLPRAVFHAAGIDPDRLLRRPIPRDEIALRMLVAYIHGLTKMGGTPAPELAAAMASHLCDLAALAMGATGDAAAAGQNGLRAARLEAVKSDIIQGIGVRDISLEETARRHGISSSYVRKLFEGDGTSFSAFLLAQRLEYARRMLLSPLHAGMAIGAIALEAGFGDLSHFNRAFRRRFGLTPSDLRARLRR